LNHYFNWLENDSARAAGPRRQHTNHCRGARLGTPSGHLFVVHGLGVRLWGWHPSTRPPAAQLRS